MQGLHIIATYIAGHHLPRCSVQGATCQKMQAPSAVLSGPGRVRSLPSFTNSRKWFITHIIVDKRIADWHARQKRTASGSAAAMQKTAWECWAHRISAVSGNDFHMILIPLTMICWPLLLTRQS